MTMSMCLVTVLVPEICYQNEVIPVSVINKHQLIGALTRIQYTTLVCMRFFNNKLIGGATKTVVLLKNFN